MNEDDERQKQKSHAIKHADFILFDQFFKKFVAFFGVEHQVEIHNRKQNGENRE